MASDSSKAGSSGSLSDRISAPLNAASTAFTPAAASTTPGPSKSTGSWADEVASPVNDKGSGIAKAQMDGSTLKSGGSALQDVQQYEVEVKLSDIQGDEKSPLYSVKSFDQLGLYVINSCLYIYLADVSLALKRS
jgi:ATP-dependent RNA helicase DDX19/DBP5